MSEPLPWERPPQPAPREPGLSVDLRSCIGCHACSIACKTEHELPLGEFRLRVRWLPRPDRPQLAFVPLFSERCGLGAGSLHPGGVPACLRACPTGAVRYGERAEADSPLSRYEAAAGAQPLGGEAQTHPAVTYVGLEPWIAGAVGKGVALDPSDPDPIYEQGGGA